jgi:hypothetical protein
MGGHVKNIKRKTKAEKTGEELPVEVEHFCTILAKIALQVAGRCEHEDTPRTPRPNWDISPSSCLDKETLAVKG